MNLEMFLNNLVYCYLLGESEQPRIDAAGIPFENFKNKNLGSEIICEYKELKKTTDHQMAYFKLQDKIRLLDRAASDLKSIPRESKLISDAFNEHWEKQQIVFLAERILENPDEGKKLLKDFTMREAKSVEALYCEEVLSKYFDWHSTAVSQGEAVLKVPGFELLSDCIGGFNPKRTMIMLGSTGFGKTNLLMNLSLQARRVMKVCYANMEMGFEDIYKRLIVIGGENTYDEFHKGIYNIEKIFSDFKSTEKKFAITSGRRLSLDQIIAWARVEFQNCRNGVLIVDYDQKIDLKTSWEIPEWKALQLAQEQLEELAKELNIFCILAAQVNREGEIAASHRQQYSAHSVLEFKNDDSHGPMITAKKNRHGKKDFVLLVKYNEQNSKVEERERTTLEELRKKSSSLFPN